MRQAVPSEMTAAKGVMCYNFVLVDELNGIYKEFTSFQMNVVAVFCIIPFGFIVAARFLKERGIIGRHFWVVVSAVLAMTPILYNVFRPNASKIAPVCDFPTFFSRITAPP